MKKGQTLVVLLVFVTVAIITTTTAVAMLIGNSTRISGMEQGGQALLIAESGAENALLKLLRNPGYSGETLTVGSDQGTITVTGSNPYTIVSVGNSGNFQRTVRVVAQYVAGVLTVNLWQEE
jgi:hypothetical protein